MKRNLLFLLFSVLILSSVFAKDSEGINYYKSGFQDVAKPILIKEYRSDSLNRAITCFYLGNIYFQENKTDSATFYFNKGLNDGAASFLNATGLAMIKMKTDVPGAEADIKNILKGRGNNKNEEILIAISRAYLANKLYDKAISYKDMAMERNSKSSSVSVLMGDIMLAKGDIGAACSNYELAILYDANCKEAYIKYARAYKNANPKLSISMLERLQLKEPNYLLVDRELADIYYSQNNFDQAAKFYGIYLKTGNASVQDLTRYALILFLNKEFAKSLDIVKLGLQKEPRNPALNRLAMWNNIDLKIYDEGLKSADLFFNQSDKPEFTYLDYRYYGQALRETKQYDLAIVQFQKALQMDSTKVELWKDISDMYNDKSDYKSAIQSYNKYESKLSEDKKTPDVIMDLGKLYYQLGTDSTTNPMEKKEAFVKADSIFAKVASLEPDNYRGNFWRARTNSTLDPESTKGLAKPYYEETAKLIETKNDPRYNPILIECYSYLGYYSLLQKDYPTSLSYWNKIITIDPNNATASKAITGIQKVLKAKK